MLRGFSGVTAQSLAIRKIKNSIAAAERSNPQKNQPWIVTPAWATGQTYWNGCIRQNAGGLYICSTFPSGVSGATAPTGTSTIVQSDGTLSWTYYGGAPTAFATDDAPVITFPTATTGFTAVPLVSGGTTPSSKFNFFGGAPLVQGGSSILLINSNSPVVGNAFQTTGKYQFSTQSPKILIDFQGSVGPSAACTIRVGDRYVYVGTIASGTAINPGYMQLDWTGGLGRVPRDITIEFTQNNFPFVPNIWVDPNSDVWATSNPNRFRIYHEGDSLVAGVGTFLTNTNTVPIGSTPYEPSIFGDLIGNEDFINGCVPSTGFIANGGTSQNTYLGRLPFLASLKPDVVIIHGNRNDASGNSNAAQQAAIVAYLTALRAALPSAIIILFGPSQGTTMAATNNVYANADNNCFVSVNQMADPYILYWSPFTDSSTASGNTSFSNAWISGTGYASTGHTTGSGSSDLVTSSDNTHPTPLGWVNTAARKLNAFKSIINSLQG